MPTYTLSTESVAALRSACTAAKLIGVEAAVVTDNKIRGASAAENAALLTELSTNIPPEIKLGIGRLLELDKRLALLGETAAVELLVNEHGDAVSLTIGSARAKAVFRCTKAGLIKYPKENLDPAAAVVTLDRDEAQLLVKALKTYGAESVSLHLSEDGHIALEGRDSTNDAFRLELQQLGEFLEDPLTIITKFATGTFTAVLSAAVADGGGAELIIGGEINTITTLVKGHGVVLVPQAD
jgi:hypothetical protein